MKKIGIDSTRLAIAMDRESVILHCNSIVNGDDVDFVAVTSLLEAQGEDQGKLDTGIQHRAVQLFWGLASTRLLICLKTLR
jgi:hypothetical protein